MLSYKDVKASSTRCIAQLNELGYELPNNIIYRVSTRMTRALGNCRYQGRGGVVNKHTLSFSHMLTNEILDDTMIHELIHVIAGAKAGHGWAFQKIAQQVNRAYGYNVGTYASENEMAVLNQVRQSNSQFVTVRCNDCGYNAQVTKRHGVYKNPSRYRCKCGGHFHIEQ